MLSQWEKSLFSLIPLWLLPVYFTKSDMVQENQTDIINERLVCFNSHNENSPSFRFICWNTENQNRWPKKITSCFGGKKNWPGLITYLIMYLSFLFIWYLSFEYSYKTGFYTYWFKLFFVSCHASMVWNIVIFIATSCPLVSGWVIHDSFDSSANISLAVITVLTWAGQKVMV